MKANELMIGDWVNSYLDGHPIQLDNERFYTIIKGYNDGIEPIPLTSEILEKNGGVKDSEYYNNGYIVGNSIGLLIVEDGFEYGYITIRYVHEFQHLLRLCGLDELADNFKVYVESK